MMQRPLNRKTCSTAIGAVNGSPQKCFYLSRTLFDNSILVIVLIVGIVFGLIQTTTSSVVSTYSNTLSSTSPIFGRPSGISDNYYYYQAIQVTVYTTGIYTFTSNSSMDTVGCLYNGTFDSVHPSLNLITCDHDDSISDHFQINITLLAGDIYVLVATTYYLSTTGDFFITTVGPALLSLTSFTSTTSWPTTGPSTPWPTPRTTSSLIPSTYFGSLSLTSPVFIRPNSSTGYYYYQVIRVTTYTAGKYTFASSSSMDTYGLFYYDPFNPSLPLNNLIISDDDSGGNMQFRINVTLSYGITYVLVVTTYSTGIIGSFLITALVPSWVSMTPFTPSTPWSTTSQLTSTWPTLPTTSSSIPSTYSATLYESSTRFARLGGTSGDDYYYRAVLVTVYTSGTYDFTSSSSIDTYGYFYYDSFDPSYPSQHLMTSDDNSGGNRQFTINVALNSELTYVLVVTTFSVYVTGSFSVIPSGPARVDLTSITRTPTLTPTNAMDPMDIVAIVSGCVLLFVIIFAVCIYQYKRQRIVNRIHAFSTRNQNEQTPNYSATHTNRNIREANRIQPPYTTSMAGAYDIELERPPPSYASIVGSLPPQY